MENTSNFSSSILNANAGELSNFQNTSASSSNSFLDSFKSISPVAWVIIVILLAFLGFNIFAYLAYGTQELADFFGPMTAKFLGIFTAITGQVVDVTAEGTKVVVETAADGTTTIIDKTADVIDTGLTSVQNVARGVESRVASSSLKIQPIQGVLQPPDIMANNALNQKLNKPSQGMIGQGQGTMGQGTMGQGQGTITQGQQGLQGQQGQQGQGTMGQGLQGEYQADESNSTIQSGSGKSGWCYIGEDRGFRSCAEVGPNDACMSGDIFPTHDVCINPNLRA